MGIQDLKIRIYPILSSAGVTRSEIVGSYARGENTDKSDLDLMVEVPENTSLIQFANLQLELEEALSMKVDLISYDAINPKLKPHLEKNSVKII